MGESTNELGFTEDEHKGGCFSMEDHTHARTHTHMHTHAYRRTHMHTHAHTLTFLISWATVTETHGAGEGNLSLQLLLVPPTPSNSVHRKTRSFVSKALNSVQCEVKLFNCNFRAPFGRKFYNLGPTEATSNIQHTPWLGPTREQGGLHWRYLQTDVVKITIVWLEFIPPLQLIMGTSYSLYY